ncbi:hypothetical protein RFI_32072 [Reticulomyxa filosa]|uniref:Uncharacterized protein n=1 Tax=Reticulomyxa filosa TaxID=46433 RepID=X6LVD5_RETFI|nr:hypothetical protein RFI_32072 [Reticulomyxa filosa]|eukprot:ETO05326.1 hypothetical protein RFI_32072 [Reticulomyxa filosa]
MSETQMDDIFKVLWKGFDNRNKFVHETCAKLIAKILCNMNERQLSNTFECLMNKFDKTKTSIHLTKSNKKITYHYLKDTMSQFDNSRRQFLLRGHSGVPEPVHAYENKDSVKDECLHWSSARLLAIISMKLNTNQFCILFQHLINGLQDKQKIVRLRYVLLLEKIVMTSGQEQLNVTFKRLTNELICNKNKSRNWLYKKLYTETLVRLNDIHSDTAFEYLMKGLKHKRSRVRKLYVVALLTIIPIKWNQTQLDNLVAYLIQNEHKYKNKNVRYSCAESLGRISTRLNEKQLSAVCDYLKERLNDKNEDILVRMSCAESLGRIAMKLDSQQFKNIVECLMNGINDDKENPFVQKYCTYSLERVLPKMNERERKALMEYKKKQVNCLIKGLKDEDKNSCYYSVTSLANFLTRLNKRQLNNRFYFKKIALHIDDLLHCFNKGIEHKDYHIRHSCEIIFKIILPELNEIQLTNLLAWLKNGFNKAYEIRYLCENLLTAISSKSNKQHICNMFESLINGFNNKDGSIYQACMGGLQTITSKLNETQLDSMLDYLKKGFHSGINKAGHSCIQILEIISPRLIKRQIAPKLDGQQLSKLIQCLQKRLNDIDNIKYSCLYIETMASNLHDQQLNDTVKCLKYGIDSKDNAVQSSFGHILQEIFKKLDKQHLNTSDHSIYSWVTVFSIIAMRLNDEQFCSLLNDLLQRLANKNANSVLSAISEDIWRRATIITLKENKPKKMRKNNIEIESLAFGLSQCNPCIYFDYNDTNSNLVNSDAFDELKRCYDRQAKKWGLPTQQKWDGYDTPEIKLKLQRSNNNVQKDRYSAIHEAAKLGDIPQLKLALKCRIDINEFNEHGQTPLHVAIHNKQWDAARYCIEKYAWIDVRESALNGDTSQTPFEHVIELMKKADYEKDKKKYLEMCKFILKKRTIYPMNQIEYAIDYVKDKLVNEDGVRKFIDDESYQTLLQEGATFLLGVNFGQLQQLLTNNSQFYWATRQNILSIKAENSDRKEFDEGWYVKEFLEYRIFLLFEICVRLKREGRSFIGLPKDTTFEQAYEKGIKELQVQLTTYWDYITAMKVHFVCPTLLGNWSWNVVDRLVNLKPNNKCCEMSLVVGHKDHSIYLSLCKTSTHILIRIDNRWMETIPSDTHPSKIVSTNDKNCTLIQPYLVAYFLCNSTNVDQHKEWLQNYIKCAFRWRKRKSKKSMAHLIGRIFLFKLMQITAICEITMLDIEFVWVMTFIIGFIIKKVRVLCSIEMFQNKMNGQKETKEVGKRVLSNQKTQKQWQGKALRHTSKSPRVPWNTFPLAFQTTFSFLFVYLVIFASKGINFANTIECERNLTPKMNLNVLLFLKFLRKVYNRACIITTKFPTFLKHFQKMFHHKYFA